MKTLSKTIILSCCLAGLRASANVIGYASPSSWDASVNLASASSINFDGIIGSASDPNLGQGLPNFTYFSSPSGLTVGGVNFQYTSTTPGLLFVLGDGYYYPGQLAELSAQASPEVLPGTPDGMTITFNSPVTAFSMTMESFFGSPFTFDVGGSSYTETAPVLGSLAFVGITSDTPFSSFTVTTPSEFAMNFASLDYISATTVPDMFSTIWTLGAGLISCGVFGRFRK